MGTQSYSIIPKVSVVEDKEQKVEAIVNWLISIDVIKNIQSDCILDIEGKGYSLSEGAKMVVFEPEFLPFNLSSNGLEIILEKNIYTTMENGLDEIICPHCSQNIFDEGLDILDDWYSNAVDEIVCPKCKLSENIHQYIFIPTWGFSDLGFIFWNWPEFKPEFILEFEKTLGTRIDVVYAHL